MNEFDDIRKKLDNYRLDSYNTSRGWAKLQKRRRNKISVVVKIFTVTAAACLLVVTGYWLFNQGNNKERVIVAGLSKTSDIQALPGDTSASEVAIITSRSPEALGSKIIKPVSRKKSLSPSASRQGNAGAGQVVIPDASLSALNDVSSKESLVTQEITHRVATQNRSWETINEQELHEMIKIPEEPRPRNSKLLTFFAEKGEQVEYTDIKFSSMPGSTQQIGF